MRTPKKKKLHRHRAVIRLILVLKEGKVLRGRIEGGEIKGSISPPSDGRIAIKIFKRKLLYHRIFQCESSVGHLRIYGRECSWIKLYSIGKIPWDKIVSGDKSWLDEIYTNHHRLEASIVCDKNRKDLKEIHIRILP